MTSSSTFQNIRSVLYLICILRVSSTLPISKSFIGLSFNQSIFFYCFVCLFVFMPPFISLNISSTAMLSFLFQGYLPQEVLSEFSCCDSSIISGVTIFFCQWSGDGLQLTQSIQCCKSIVNCQTRTFSLPIDFCKIFISLEAINVIRICVDIFIFRHSYQEFD